MSSHSHHTMPHDAWTTDILPHLPPDRERQARTLGAYQRMRAFASADDLLRGLLAYAATVTSLRHLGAWGVLQDVADLAPSSWWERVRAAGPWLQWLVNRLLALPRQRWLTQAVRGRVLLVDASCLGWHGGQGDELRLHLAMDLLAGGIEQVVLTDRHGREQVSHFTLHVGDLLILDGGYGYRDRIATIQHAQADAIVRIYPPTFPLETATGRPLDVRAWLDQVRGSHASQVAFYQHAGQRRAVRILAYRLPEPQRRGAQRKARTRARKRQYPLQSIGAYFADWIILITTLLDTATWPDATIWRLYGARWQIELLFKRMKQFLDIGQVRSRTLASALPCVWALLVLWLLHEPHLAAVRRACQVRARPHPATLPGQHPAAEAVVSRWGVSRLLLDILIQAIQGTLTMARVRVCLPRLHRYLVTHPRRDRVHQATEVWAWLSGVRFTSRAAQRDAADGASRLDRSHA